MSKKIFTLFLAVCLSMSAYAQSLPANRVVLVVAPKAKSVSFSFRLAEGTTNLPVDFGIGEGAQEYTGSSASLTRISYTFKTVLEEERLMVVDASKLTTLRILFSNTIRGISEIIAPELTNFNCDYTDISAYPTVDFSTCTKLENLTLSSSGVQKVKLPETGSLRSVQVSPALNVPSYLKEINLNAAPNLEELSLSQSMIDTLDLRLHTGLKKLVVPLGKAPLRAILGAKKLTSLTDFNTKGNALAFDQLPDLNETPLEKFLYADQKTYLAAPQKIKDLTIDLSSLLSAKGIAETVQQTVFSWEMKRDQSFVTIPADKISEKNGVFTFDRSLVVNDTLQVRFSMVNPGYPGIGLKGSNQLKSEAITLTAPLVTELVISSPAAGDAAKEIGANTDLLSLTITGLISAEDFKAIARNTKLKALDLKDARIVGVEGSSVYRDNLFPALLSTCNNLSTIKFPQTMERMEQLALINLIPQNNVALYFYTARPPIAIMPFTPELAADGKTTLYVARGLKPTYETDGLFSAFAKISETDDEPAGISPINDNPETNTMVIEGKVAGDIANAINGRFDLVNLTVSGPADSRDLRAIDENRRLRKLDLYNLSILADSYNGVEYAADVLPDFLGYAYLTSLSLPKNIKELKAFAVGNSVKLTDLYVFSSVPPKDNGAFCSITPQRATLHVPQGAGDAYRSASIWKNFRSIVEDAYASAPEAPINEAISIVPLPEGIEIEVADAALVRIYSTGGSLLWQQTVEDFATVRVPSGFYFILIGNKTYKVAVH